MRYRIIIPTVLVICLLLTQSATAQGNIQNPDFENDIGWSFYNNGENWTGQYSSEWASHGVRSFKIYIPGSCAGDGIYPGENTYGEVFQQNVDLTGASELWFDLLTFGSWDVPGLGNDYYHSAEVWIDGTKVYSRERQVGQFLNQQIILNGGYSGSHTISFRMQGHADFCSSIPRGLFIDNTSLVIPPPTLSINYSSGKPGSFFTLTGANFPSTSTATITANGSTLGTVQTDSSGDIAFLLYTDQADEGIYIVTATVNPGASATFVLDSSEQMRPQEGSGIIFNVPSGIAYTHIVYLPLTLK